jgi:hypothetical protein
MNPIRPATPRAIDNPTGKTRARHDAMPNMAHPSANSTTVTSHALTRELPVRSAVNVSGVTPVIHGMAKPSNHMSPAKATVPVTVIQKATAPNTPASAASRQYNATNAINSSGKGLLRRSHRNSWDRWERAQQDRRNLDASQPHRFSHGKLPPELAAILGRYRRWLATVLACEGINPAARYA